MDEDLGVLARLGLALAVGMIIGVERGWTERNAPDGTRVAGVRTFALLGLMGGLCALLSERDVLLGLGLAGVALLLAAARATAARAGQGVGITTGIAALITFTLGALALRGHAVPAMAAAVATALLLDLKPKLHGFLRQLERREVLAGLQFLLVAGVVLPILPDRGYGPNEAINPREIWFMVVLVAGLSFCGYVAVRIAGARTGILLTALFGGLVSSTAVTVALSRIDRNRPGEGLPVAFGIVLASTVMVVRVAVLAFVIDRRVLEVLAIPLAAMLAGAMLAGWLVWRRPANPASGEEQVGGAVVQNPLDLRAAIQFGLFLGVVLLLTPILRDWLGNAGVLVLAAISGVTDVDAITLAMARLAGDPAMRVLAGSAIVVATASNMIAKAAIAAATGGTQARARAAPALGGLAACGAAGLAFALL